MTAISLFSGCGGDTLGLHQAGLKVLAFNEFKKPAINTHKLNFPDSVLIEHNSQTDITTIPDKMFEEYANKIDIVFAGFPCQGYSTAGKRKVEDPRNQLYNQFVRVVKLVKPKFFIGENVVGLVSMKSGPKETDLLVLTIIMNAFKEIGYNLTYKVLEAIDYGVPQKRKRLILVGWDVKRFPSFDPISFWPSINVNSSQATIRSFITKSMEDAYELPTENIPTDFSEYALPISQDVEPTGTPHPYVVLKASAKNETYGEKTYKSLISCYKRDSPIHSEVVDLDAPAKTIICTYDHQPRLLVGLRKPDGKSYVRCFSCDELKQIQGFPADYKMTGNKKEQIVQIGNAVPPPLIQAVASAIMKCIGDESVDKITTKVKKIKIRK